MPDDVLARLADVPLDEFQRFRFVAVERRIEDHLMFDILVPPLRAEF